jgi:hypothetical protein
VLHDHPDTTALWTTSAQRVLVRHDLVAIPVPGAVAARPAALTTVAANLAYYGFALSAAGYGALARVSDDDLDQWWGEVELVLAAITGDDKRMDRFVVYKNFPAEVLALDEVEY